MIKVFVLIFLCVFSLNANDEKKYMGVVKPLILKVDNIDNDIITIKKGNIQLGKSGVVLHIYENTEKIILASVSVISSNENESKLKISEFDGLIQDAIPTNKRKVKAGDVMVLGYLYNKSMIITPNLDTYNDVKKRFFLNNFLHPDIFGAKLRISNRLFPRKEDIQNFAREQNLGTIFLVMNKKVYIIDSKNFSVLSSFETEYDVKKEYAMPFYTRIEKFEESVMTFSFSSEEFSYESHYKSLLGIK
jgi:ribosomal protein L24